MKEKGLKFLKEKLDCVKVWLIVLAAIVAILSIISCVNIKCSFLDKIHDTLLSGVIGALLSCAFVLFGFHLSNTAKAIDNQLELRKLFSEELRWEVHRTLDTGDKSCWYKKSGEEMPEKLCEEKWQNSEAFKKFFEPALDDYMGVFEIAYMMIKKRQLPKKNFKASYLYRLESLAEYEVVKKKVTGKEHNYWEMFRELMEMYNLL